MEPTPIDQPAATGGLPPGVSPASEPGAPPVATPAPMAAAPITPPTEKWNALEIATGIVVVSLFCFTVYYYHFKTRQEADWIKKTDSKLNSMQSDINTLKPAA